MKIVNDLYDTLKHPEYYKSQFESKKENPINILFIDPVMTSFDHYTMIMPYLALDDIDEISTALTGLYRFSEIDKKEETKLAESTIKWADIMVFGMTLDSFGGENGLFHQLKEINPELKIIQTVEFDFYEINSTHYLLDEKEIRKFLSNKGIEMTTIEIAKKRSALKKSIIQTFENNFRAADRLLVLNRKLQDKLLKKDFPDVKCIPILIHEETMKEGIDWSNTLGQKNLPGALTISIDLTLAKRDSFKKFLPILREIQKKHGKLFKVVVIGDNPKKTFGDIGIDYEHLNRSSIIHQYKNIVKSAADLHLVLSKKTDYWENSETIIDFVERSVFATPLVTFNVDPFQEIIKNEKNGYLIEKRSDLKKIADELIADNSRLIEMSESIRVYATQTFSYNENTIRLLAEAYVGEFNTKNNFEDER